MVPSMESINMPDTPFTEMTVTEPAHQSQTQTSLACLVLNVINMEMKVF